MITRTSRIVVLAAAAALAAAGCSSSDNTESAPSSSTTPSVTTINPADMTDQQAPPNRLVIDVTIKAGEVTPIDAQLQGKVNEPIVVRVNSDVADELHVHSEPEHTFPIEAKTGQQFQFTVGAPGTVAVELGQLNRTVASIQVQQ